MHTNNVVIVKEVNLRQDGRQMDWIMTNMTKIRHQAFPDLGWETYWETRKGNQLEGHILSMSNQPRVESLILSDSLLRLQKIEHSQKQIHLRKRPVSICYVGIILQYSRIHLKSQNKSNNGINVAVRRLTLTKTKCRFFVCI